MSAPPFARCTTTSNNTSPTQRSQAVDEICGNHAARLVPLDVGHRPGWQPLDVGIAAAARVGLARLDCDHPLVGTRANGCVARPPAVPRTLPGRTCVLV